jgi:ArsR family transcriptional regulator
MILSCLERREMSVGELAETIGAPLSTISQHLSALRSKHIVASKKVGQTVFYTVTDKRVVEACYLIRTVLIDVMKKRGELALEIDPSEVIVDD